MDRVLLKNVILTILLLINVLLAGILLMHLHDERESARRTTAQLSALYAASGVALSPDQVPSDAVAAKLSATRSESRERAAAAFLLGSGLSATNRGGGLVTWSGSRGAGLFREGGHFEAAGTLSGEDEAYAFCSEFCSNFGYTLVGAVPADGNGTLTAFRTVAGLPVFNAAVSFTLEGGVVTRCEGIFLSDQISEAAAEAPVSAVRALTAFYDYRIASGAAVSEIRKLSLCYCLTGSAAPLTLSPAWEIETDARNYYVNLESGEVLLS